MAKKTVIASAKEQIVDVAKSGADEAMRIAGEAASAALIAAAGIVVQEVAKSFGQGQAALASATEGLKSGAINTIEKKAVTASRAVKSATKTRTANTGKTISKRTKR
jgi:hypothetical protein